MHGRRDLVPCFREASLAGSRVGDRYDDGHEDPTASAVCAVDRRRPAHSGIASRAPTGSAPPADYEMGNWYASTYPGSPFYANLLVARPSHGRATLFNRRLTIRDRDGSVARRVLAGIDDYREALVEHFGLWPADDELVGIAAAMSSRSADEKVPRAFV